METKTRGGPSYFLRDDGEGLIMTRAHLRSWGVPANVDLGSAVLTSLAPSRTGRMFNLEGVVIEIVPPHLWVRSTDVVARVRQPERSSVARYVVQCWEYRLVRYSREFTVKSA